MFLPSSFVKNMRGVFAFFESKTQEISMSIDAGRLIPLYFRHDETVVQVTFFLSLKVVQFLLSREINLLSASNDVLASITATARDLFMKVQN